jgi:hypothetical protein
MNLEEKKKRFCGIKELHDMTTNQWARETRNIWTFPGDDSGSGKKRCLENQRRDRDMRHFFLLCPVHSGEEIKCFEHALEEQ